MPIFEAQLKPLDHGNAAGAIKMMENHIRAMQEQLEWQLAHLDSSNVIELSTDKTAITGGGVQITGEQIGLSGKNGEAFRAGYDGGVGQFRFELTGAGGQAVFYMDSGGQLVMTKAARLSIDCGEW